jgi:isocitrate dehydrogenase (NAD+)
VRTRYQDVDVVIVRENTEDLDAGIEYEAGSEDAEAVIASPNALQPRQTAAGSAEFADAIIERLTKHR